MTTLKLQYSNYEEGEFTKEQSVDYSTFIEIFEKETNNIVYSKYSWSLENNRIKFYINTENEYFIIIEHIAKDYYNLYFCDIKCKNTYECKIDKETIAEYISIFFDKEFNDFQDKFSRTNKKAANIIKRFDKKDFVYKINLKILIFDISFNLLSFSAIAVILYYFSVFINWQFIIPFVIVLIFSLITETIKIRSHLIESQNKLIIISKGNKKIKIIINEHEYIFSKSDIKKVIYYKPLNYGRAFNIDYFNFYNYAQLILINGSIINIPHMLINSTIIEEKLFDIEKEIDLSYLRFINLKTNIIS